MKLKALFFVAVIAIAVSFTGCTLAGMELALIGFWEASDGNNFTFSNDDSGSFNSYSFDVIECDSIEDTFTIKWDIDGTEQEYEYELSGDNLKLSRPGWSNEYKKESLF